MKRFKLIKEMQQQLTARGLWGRFIDNVRSNDFTEKVKRALNDRRVAVGTFVSTAALAMALSMPGQAHADEAAPEIVDANEGVTPLEQPASDTQMTSQQDVQDFANELAASAQETTPVANETVSPESTLENNTTVEVTTPEVDPENDIETPTDESQKTEIDGAEVANDEENSLDNDIQTPINETEENEIKTDTIDGVVIDKDENTVIIDQGETPSDEVNSNENTNDSQAIVYKDNMSYNDLATALGMDIEVLRETVNTLGITASFDGIVSYEDAQKITTALGKELKQEEVTVNQDENKTDESYVDYVDSTQYEGSNSYDIETNGQDVIVVVPGDNVEEPLLWFSNPVKADDIDNFIEGYNKAHPDKPIDPLKANYALEVGQLILGYDVIFYMNEDGTLTVKSSDGREISIEVCTVTDEKYYNPVDTDPLKPVVPEEPETPVIPEPTPEPETPEVPENPTEEVISEPTLPKTGDDIAPLIAGLGFMTAAGMATAVAGAKMRKRR